MEENELMNDIDDFQAQDLQEGYEMIADDQVRDAVAKASEFINGKKKKDDKNDFSFRFQKLI